MFLDRDQYFCSNIICCEFVFEQVSRVNREIQNIERRILLLDEDCQKLDNIDFRNNLQQASEELNRVKVKVKQWEHDTALLRESIPKSDGERK